MLDRVGGLWGLLGLRPEDRRGAVAGFSTLVLIMAAHAMLETARDALFLTHLPPESLPFCYLGIALLAVFAARINQRLLARWDKRLVLTATLTVSAAVTLGLWVVVESGDDRSLYLLYIWSGLAATVTVVQTWLMVGDFVTVSQAKRVFSVVGAGAVVGATIGSLTAERLVARADPRHLVAGAALVFLAAALEAAFVLRHSAPVLADPAQGPRVRLLEAGTNMGMLRSQPYLRRLLLIVLVGTLVLTGSDYLFKSIVIAEVPTTELPRFFARFYLGLNAIALVVQLLLSSFLLRVLGVNRTLLVLPVLMLFGVAGVGAGSALISVLLLKGADGSLRHSVHRTATEVLYLPLPADVRERFKVIIDAVGQRGGQALASLAILGAVYIGAGPSHLAMALGLLITVWLLALIDMRQHYVQLFRGNLRAGTIETRVGLTDLDLHSLEALIAALNSEEDGEVLASLDLLEHHQRASLVPVLLLFHPSSAIVLRALELFDAAGRRDHASITRRLLKHDDRALRAAALRTLAALEVDDAVLRGALDDEDPLMHATALVGLLARTRSDEDALSVDLAGHLRDPDPEVRRALANAIRYQRDPKFAPALTELVQSPEREVRQEVVRAMVAIPDSRYLDVLLPLLAESRLRPEARKAIVAIGPVAIYFLDEALWDTSLPRRVRRHLPRTISRFEPTKAAEILMSHLLEEKDSAVRFKILRGLGRLRADTPSLILDNQVLQAMTTRTIERAIEVLAFRLAIDEAHAADPKRRTRGGELLSGIFHEKEQSSLERAFRLLGLLHPEEDFELLYRGLTRRGRQGRAQSRELLEHVLGGVERAALLALFDDSSDHERLAAATAATGFVPSSPRYEDLLVTMLDDPSEAVQSVVAHHIGELGLRQHSARLRQVGARSDHYLADVVARALSMLDGHSRAEGPHAS